MRRPRPRRGALQSIAPAAWTARGAPSDPGGFRGSGSRPGAAHPAARPPLTQAEPAAAGHGGAEPVHVRVPLGVGLPHHLRLHDLGLPRHGGG